MMYMHDHWAELSFIRIPVGYIAQEDKSTSFGEGVLNFLTLQ